MVEGKLISTGNVAYVLGLNPKKLHRWYKEVLSGYAEALEKGEVHKHDLPSKTEKQNIRVPILIKENIGQQMCIDEKTIDGICYTILSNKETMKIALMAATLQTEQLVQLMDKFDNCMFVRSLSRDMASNYDWFGRQVFMNAYHSVDKFHVIKNAIEQLQAIRIRYRQEELAKRRIAKEQFDKIENERTWEAVIKGDKYIRRPFNYKETVHANCDTSLQLLARSRGLLFKLSAQWTPHQAERANILFDQYPEIKEAHELITKLRHWYQYTSEENLRANKERKLDHWLDEVQDVQIYEMDNLASTINTHRGVILNYFIEGRTNASAEALNSLIQRFIHTNYGARNKDFFLYRLKTYFA